MYGPHQIPATVIAILLSTSDTFASDINFSIGSGQSESGVIPFDPPTTGGVLNDPNTLQPFKPLDGHMYEYCVRGYGCTFLHRGKDEVYRAEARDRFTKESAIYQQNLDSEMAKLDSDLNAMRSGHQLTRSPEGIEAQRKIDSTRFLLESSSKTRSSTANLVKSSNEEFLIELNEKFESSKGVDEVPSEGNSNTLKEFIADSHLREGIDGGLRRAQEVENIIRAEGGIYETTRLNLNHLGRESLYIARNYLEENNLDDSQVAYKLGISLVDMGLSFVPVVGWSKDVYEAIRGKSLVTGAELDDFDRSIAVIGVVTAGLGSGLFKSISTARKGTAVFAKALGKVEGIRGIEKIADLATTSLKAAEDSGIAFRFNDVERFKNNPLTGMIYSEKVLGQIKADRYHGFPELVDNFAGLGSKRDLIGGDGIKRTLIELEGTYVGKPGKFEWILEPDNTVNHRLFKPRK